MAAYGSEAGERGELRRHLGWKPIVEVAKFYGHEGADAWYYYGYGPDQETLEKRSVRAATEAPGPRGPWFNFLASAACVRLVFGDVAVVRSGPSTTDGQYAEMFTMGNLGSTAWYCDEANVPQEVFQARERSRASRLYGFPASGSSPGHHSKTAGKW